jgi:hypothetical protein
LASKPTAANEEPKARPAAIEPADASAEEPVERVEPASPVERAGEPPGE